MPDVPNQPTVDYSNQAVILDTVLVERTSNKLGTYLPIEPGAPFKKGTHTAKQLADFADAEFVAQKATEDAEWMQRIFARPPSTQDIANWEASYFGEVNEFPIFLRRYLEKRDDYAARTKLQSLAGLYRIKVTAAGTGYTSAPTISFTGGTGSGGSAIAILNNSGGIAKITLKSEGSWTVAPTVVITGGGGSGATATASVQPTSCVLTVEKTGEAPEPYNSLYILVQRLYETLPGPYFPDRDYDPLLGPVQIRRRAVIFTTQTATETATGSITYKTRDENAAVAWEIERIWSDGTGGAGNPAYPIRITDIYDKDRGPVQALSQLVVQTGAEAGSLEVLANVVFSRTITNNGSGYTSAPTVSFSGGGGNGATAIARISSTGSFVALIITNGGAGYSSAPTVVFTGGGGTGAAATVATAPFVATLIEYKPGPNEFLLDRVIETWVTPGDAVPWEVDNEDGTTTAMTKTLELNSSITEGEAFGGAGNAFWIKTTSQYYSLTISWKITATRPVPGNTITTARTDRKMNVSITTSRTLKKISALGTMGAVISSTNVVNTERGEANSALVAYEIVTTIPEPAANSVGNAIVSSRTISYPYPARIDIAQLDLYGTAIGYHRPEGRQLTAKIKTWWVVSTTKPTVSVDSILPDTIVINNVTYPNVLHDFTIREYNSIPVAIPATTPSYTEYMASWVGQEKVIEGDAKPTEYTKLWEAEQVILTMR